MQRRTCLLVATAWLAAAQPAVAEAGMGFREGGNADVVEPASDLPSTQPYASAVAEAARSFAIPESWIRAVMYTESRGNPRAVSPAGAMGLMQVMPATWAELTARYHLGSDPFDAHANIHAGAAYLRMMFERYGNLVTALAAYNAGPGRTDAYLAGRRGLPRETLAYVAGITRTIGEGGITLAASHLATERKSCRSSALFAARSEAPVTAAGAAISDAFRPSNPLFVALSGEKQP